MSNVQYWLLMLNGNKVIGRYQIPVNPEQLEVSSGSAEVTVNKEEGITEDRYYRNYRISSFFPKEYNPSYCDARPVMSPIEYTRLIDQWRSSGQPIRLVATGTNINKTVVVTDFSFDADRAGHGGDIYYSLTLKDYRNYTSELITSPIDNTITNKGIGETDEESEPRTLTPQNESESLLDMFNRLGLKETFPNKEDRIALLSEIVNVNIPLSDYKQQFDAVISEYKNVTTSQLEGTELTEKVTEFLDNQDIVDYVRRSGLSLSEVFNMFNPKYYEEGQTIKDRYGFADVYNTPLTKIYKSDNTKIEIKIPSPSVLRKAVQGNA